MPALATVTDLETWLGTPNSPGTVGTLLVSCLDRAERMLADLCGRPADAPWATASRTEYLDGNLGDGILLTYTPVTAVSAVTLVTGVSDSVGTETGESIATSRLAVDGYPIGGTFTALTGLLHFRHSATTGSFGFEFGEPVRSYGLDPGPVFPAGHYRVKVAYTGGVSATVIPAQLRQAVLEVATDLFRRSGQATASGGGDAFARQQFDINSERIRAMVSTFVRFRA